MLDDLIQQKGYVLVILDTLGAVSDGAGNKNVYEAEYKEAVGLSALAHKHGICLLIVHHTNKRDAMGPNARASGSHGRTGGVDSQLQLSESGQLEARPRDGESSTLYLERSENGGWRVRGPLGHVPTISSPLRRERQEVADSLRSGPKSARELAEALGLKPDTARKRLERMETDGLAIRLDDGRYQLADSPPDRDVLVQPVRPVQVSEMPRLFPISPVAA